MIFQEYIPLALDLRVTVVDGEVFATAFRSQPEYEVDYRAGIGSAEVTPYTLPDEVSAKLLEMMEQMELKFGAADFRVTPEGEHVFFEINPAGEYLYRVPTAPASRSRRPSPRRWSAITAPPDADRQRLPGQHDLGLVRDGFGTLYATYSVSLLVVRCSPRDWASLHRGQQENRGHHLLSEKQLRSCGW